MTSGGENSRQHAYEAQLERIRARGFGYCYWRYGLLEFGLPVAIGVTVVGGLVYGLSAAELLDKLLWHVLFGASFGALLWSVGLWNEARVHARRRELN